MQFSVLIAVAFIVATIAIATFSPFENLPQYSPQETTTAATTEEGSADGSAAEDGDSSEEEASGESQSEESEESYDDTSASGSYDNIRGHWPEGEEPPP